MEVKSPIRNAARTRYQRENRARTIRVRDILNECYSAKTENSETALTDLLADIRHFCDAKELAFSDVDRRAHEHYSAEIVQARTGAEV